MSKIVIIGAGPGLAWSVAQRFAREKWTVVMAARNAERIKGYEKTLQDQGVEARAHVLDVTDIQALDRLVRKESEEGGIDLLNYNAAVIRPNTYILDTPLEAIQSDLMIDVGGAIVAARAAIPAMRDRGSGTILFSGGQLAFEPWAKMLTLGVGKAGMRNAACALSKDPACEQLHVAYVNIDAHIVGDVNNEIADYYLEIHSQRGNREWDLNYMHPFDHPEE